MYLYLNSINLGYLIMNTAKGITLKINTCTLQLILTVFMIIKIITTFTFKNLYSSKYFTGSMIYIIA